MRKKKEKVAEVVEIAKAVEVKERKHASAQELIRRMLVESFLFQPISKRATSFGERLVLRAPEAGVEAQLGVYRVCFYFDGAAERNLPTKRAPLCFDTEQRNDVRAFLEKIFGKPVKKNAAKSKQRELFPLRKEAA